MSASEAVQPLVLLPSTNGTAANGAGSTISNPRNIAGTTRRALMAWTTSGTQFTVKVQGSPDGTLWQDMTATITSAISPNTTQVALAFDCLAPYVRCFVASADGTTTGAYVVLV